MQSRKVAQLKLTDKVVEVEIIEEEWGYHMCNLQEWNKEVAHAIAQLERLELKEQHWAIIKFLREYYNEYQISPSIRAFLGATRKAGLSLELESCFPKGVIQASGVAGLPLPTCYRGI